MKTMCCLVMTLFFAVVSVSVDSVDACEMEVTQTADVTVTKEDHDINYEICAINTSGECDLYLVNVYDTLLGDLTAVFGGAGAVLAAGATECRTVTYTVQVGDPDPLVNEVTFTYENAAGTPYTRAATAEVDLIHPSMELSAECMTVPVLPGGNADIDFTFNNTGDVELFFDVLDNTCIADFTLAAGGTRTETVTLPDPYGMDGICYTVDVVASLPQYDHLDNTYAGSVTRCCYPPCCGLDAAKTADVAETCPGHDINYEICAINISGECDLYLISIFDTLLGDLTATFGGAGAVLAGGATECHTVTYTVQPDDPDPLPNEVTFIYENAAGWPYMSTATAEVDLVHMATIDFEPSTLNLRSKGKYVTCYIELSEGHDPADIDVSTLTLDDAIPAKLSPTSVGDYDTDGIPDLMVKFGRSELTALIAGGNGSSLWLAEKGDGVPPIQHGAEFDIKVSGELEGGTQFSGTYVIRVINPGRGKDRSTAAEGVVVEIYPTATRVNVRISYELASEGPVSLCIFDAAGRLVRTLEAGHKGAGAHTMTWDRKADNGDKVGSGVYFIRLGQRGKVNVQKLLVLE